MVGRCDGDKHAIGRILIFASVMSLSAASCPFCAIARSNPPYSPLEPWPSSAQKTEGHAYILLATPVVQAFLDLAPISRGHVLLATRAHKEKLADVSVKEGRALGAWMKVVSKAVLGGLEGRVTDWNIVQNNGSLSVPPTTQHRCGGHRDLQKRY